MKIIIDEQIDTEDVEIEDNGCAKIVALGQEGFFVRLISYSEADPPDHQTMQNMIGKRVRVTIEVVE